MVPAMLAVASACGASTMASTTPVPVRAGNCETLAQPARLASDMAMTVTMTMAMDRKATSAREIRQAMVLFPTALRRPIALSWRPGWAGALLDSGAAAPAGPQWHRADSIVNRAKMLLPDRPTDRPDRTGPDRTGPDRTGRTDRATGQWGHAYRTHRWRWIVDDESPNLNARSPHEPSRLLACRFVGRSILGRGGRLAGGRKRRPSRVALPIPTWATRR